MLAIRAGSSRVGSPRTSLHGSSGPSSSTSTTSSPAINLRHANTTADAEVISRLILGRDVGGHVSLGVDLRALVKEVRPLTSWLPFHLLTPLTL